MIVSTQAYYVFMNVSIALPFNKRHPEKIFIALFAAVCRVSGES